MGLFRAHSLIYILIGFMVVLLLPLSAQNITKSENDLRQLNDLIKAKSKDTALLQSELNVLLEIIEIEKRYEAPDNDYIATLLAEALNKTNQIDNIENDMGLINGHIFSLKKRLYTDYSYIIDSLKSHESAELPATVNKIKYYNAKKISVSPLLKALSFDPVLIEKISFKNNQSKEERAIYLNYLNSALKEIDSTIVLLNNKSEDLKEMIRLDEMAEDFADDLGNISIGGALLSSDNIQQVFIQTVTTGNTPFVKDRVYIFEIQHSLQPFVYSKIDITNYDDSQSLYLEDYYNLIVETKITLKLYSDVIYNIIDSHLN